MHPSTPDDHAGSGLELAVTPGPVSTVVVSGELDIAAAPALTEALDRLTADGATEIALDLSGVTFCDSTGLGAFVHADQALQARGARLVLVNPSERVRRLLAITSLDQELEIR